MRIFVAASYSSKVNYETGHVHADYRAELEAILANLESYEHEVFCALRADGYRINDTSPEEAFRLDKNEIIKADAIFAIVSDLPSVGVQTEIGMAIALGKPVVFAHYPDHKLAFFNAALVQAGHASEVTFPLHDDPYTKGN